MKVLIALQFRSPRSGLHENVIQQVSALQSAGHDVRVLCPSSIFAEEAKQRQIDVVEFTPKSLTRVVNKIGKEKRPDLVVVHPGITFRAGLRLKRKFGTALILNYHNRYQNSYHTRLSSLAHLIDCVLVTSESIRDFLVEEGNFRPSRIHVIMNAAPPMIKKSSFELSGVPARHLKKNILTASRLVSQKKRMISVLKLAFRSLAKQVDNGFNWTIVGDGERRSELEKEAASVNEAWSRRAIRFLGEKPWNELASYFEEADLYVGPGRTVSEAFNFGLPVIAFDAQTYIGPIHNGSLDDALYSNFGVFLHNMPKKKETLVADINRVFDDDSFYYSMVLCSNETRENVLNSHLINRKFLQICERVYSGSTIRL